MKDGGGGLQRLEGSRLGPKNQRNVTCLGDGSGGGWRRQWQPTPVLLPGKSHGQRSLVGCSPWGCEELNTTERLHFHFSISCTGEGNGNTLQCSCLENPRDRGASCAAVYGVAQIRTRLKRLSSSSSSSITEGALNVCAQACPTLCNPMDCSPPGCSFQWDFPGKSTGVGCHCLL